MDAVRHYTRLSQKNFSIDTHFYPLGSCTMKYNPRACNTLAMLPQFLARHPLAPEDTGQGFLACLYELQEILKEVTGMAGVSLTPMAGAQGEFAGVAMIRAYHESRGDAARTEIIVPDAAHGTNPATAVMCGYKVVEIPTCKKGNVDLAALKAAVGPRTAASCSLILPRWACSRNHSGHPEDRSRCRRTLLRRSESRAILGRVSTWLRRDPRQSAQDLLRPMAAAGGRRPGGRERAVAAVSAGTHVYQGLPASAENDRRSPSAGCPPSWATPASCCGHMCMPDARGRRHARVWRTSPPSTPTT